MTGAITEGLFTVDDDGSLTLLGGHSTTSGFFHFPRGPLCPFSGADDVVDVDLPTTGRLMWWTTVNAAPPGYFGDVPYGFGVVELDCDPPLRVIGRITEADSAALEAGQPMRVVSAVVPDEHGEAAVTWAFEPVVR